MERLTARSPKNNMAYLVNIKPNEQDVESPYPNTLKCILDCFNRLAAYEDTGLTPEQIEAQQQEIDRLKAQAVVMREALEQFKYDYEQGENMANNYRNVCDIRRSTNLVDEDYPGLKVKYRVYKARNGEPVEDCFVLRPEKDISARAALECYADSTPNSELGRDIKMWLEYIREMTVKKVLGGAEDET